MVDKSHKGSIKHNKNKNFESDFLSPDAVQEEFDLINANKDYMDSNIVGGADDDNDSIPEMEMFFQQQQKMNEEDGSLRVRRTRGFNEIDDNIDFNEFTNVDEDDEGFGEIGPNGKVIKEDSEGADELNDMVGDLDFEDSKKDMMFDLGDRRQRHTSAIVSNSELFKGLEEIKKKGDDLDERLKMIVGEDEWQPGQRERKQSFIQKTRQALKARKIEKEIYMEQNQGTVEEGSMAGMPRLMQLRPRTNVYDQIAKGKLQSYNFDNLTEEQEKEILQKKEIMRYKKILDQDLNESKQGSKEKIKLDEAMDDEEEETYENFLQDFYQEMQIDGDKSLDFL